MCAFKFFHTFIIASKVEGLLTWFNSVAWPLF